MGGSIGSVDVALFLADSRLGRRDFVSEIGVQI